MYNMILKNYGSNSTLNLVVWPTCLTKCKRQCVTLPYFRCIHVVVVIGKAWELRFVGYLRRSVTKTIIHIFIKRHCTIYVQTYKECRQQFILWRNFFISTQWAAFFIKSTSNVLSGYTTFLYDWAVMGKVASDKFIC